MITATLDREELKGSVVRTALRMFLDKGVDVVRMDDIAAELSISKRTLYEIFSSKEGLLLECFDCYISEVRQRIDAEITSGQDVLTVTLEYLEMMASESDRAGSVAYSNLDRYPKLKARIDDQGVVLKEHFREFIKLGISQNVFRNDIELDLILQAFALMSRLVCTERGKGEMSLERIVDSTLIVLFRGIATPNGFRKLEEYRNKTK